MRSATRFRWTSAACTDVGLVRQVNEDAFLDLSERGVWAVADGMGGHGLGDLASRMVVEALKRLDAAHDLDEQMAAARQRLQDVNRQLLTEAAMRDLRVIGTTIVVLLAGDRQGGYLWAGDSRLYLHRNGRLKQLTRDHKQVEELKSRGFRPEEALYLTSPNVITRAVGAMETLDLDGDKVGINDGDMFLLCSDGLSNEVSEQEIGNALIPGNCQQGSESLVELALRRGGRDNITAIVVRDEDQYSTDKTILNPAL